MCYYFIMLEIFKSHHPVRHIRSFKHAFDGIFHALLNEANFRVQVVIVILAIVFGKILKISNVEWALVTLSMSLLLASELVNTTVEEIMDHFVKHDNQIAKVIKDLSAGFVLINAIGSLIILYLVYGTKF
jgi:diacylglycerol kinase